MNGEPTSGDARCLYRLVNSKVCQTRRVSQNLDTSTISAGPTYSISLSLVFCSCCSHRFHRSPDAKQQQQRRVRSCEPLAIRVWYSPGKREREKRKSRRGSCQATLRRVERALSITVASDFHASEPWLVNRPGDRLATELRHNLVVRPRRDSPRSPFPAVPFHTI